MNTTTTTEELNTARSLFRNERIPKSILEIIDASTAELEASAAPARALKVGNQAPDFVLPDPTGRSVRLYTELNNGHVVIVFYRGGWCPYCNIHLRGFQKLLADFQTAGARVIAISPQLPDQSLSTQEKEELAFSVLSDVGLHTADAFGVAYEVPQAMLGVYRDFEVSLDEVNGAEGNNRLPMPATFVVRADRVIAYARVDTDITLRAEPLEVLKLVNELKDATA
jgi:peroxiredoxin